MLLAFFYIASKYVCNMSHDTYVESYETTFVSMPANCINDLKLVSALPETSRLAFNFQQNWYHPGSGTRSRPTGTLHHQWVAILSHGAIRVPYRLGILPKSGRASPPY